MQARGPLMIEHRLIERLVARVDLETARARQIQKIEPLFIYAAVDFLQTYADRTHHGKEEGILFRDLGPKPLSPENRRMMDELTEEHAYARKTTLALVESNERYRAGFAAALTDILVRLQNLIDFYPRHVDKEDRVFFPAAMMYLSDEEQTAMLREFAEFDRKMIHLKYESVVAGLEKG